MTQVLGYYSHSKEKFNTIREALEYEYIKRTFRGFVINPNTDLKTQNPFEMNVNFSLIYKMNFMVVSATKGTIGRCSFWEVKQALTMKIPVFEIYSAGRSFKYRKVVGLKQISEKNHLRYAKLISKPSPAKIKRAKCNSSLNLK